jgi:SAM-dependent methyltransferase
MVQTILPTLAKREPRRVLFVGVELYTRRYADFYRSAEYWTLDIRPEVARYGSRNRHKTASVVEADEAFETGFFDQVFLNGVFGWGVDALDQQEKTLRALHRILAPGGILVLGWNDNRVRDPLQLHEMESFHHGVEGLPSRQTFPGSTHVYDFLTAKRR